MLIDSHCHIHGEDFTDDQRAVIIESMREQGICAVVVGTDAADSELAVACATTREHIHASVGIHPCNQEHAGDRARLEVLAGHSRVVAIGETGLDYYRFEGKTTAEIEEEKARQKDLFRFQVELALAHDKPVIIHAREAHNDILAILRAYSGRGVRGVAHCFTGTATEAQDYLSIGFMVSFAGIVSFKPKASNPSAMETLHASVRLVPDDRLLIETDSPYLAPEPYRGKQNTPLYLPSVAGAVARIRGQSSDDVARITTQNARTLFGI